MEASERLRDAVPDLLDTTLRREARLPPAAVRARVGRTSARREFAQAGAQAFGEIVTAFQAVRDSAGAYGRWLDFGCGSGRIARHFAESRTISHLTGSDVDTEAIEWARRSIPGATFMVTKPSPPTNLPAESFDVAYAASVFTHFDEPMQFLWLSEVHRLLRPGGFLIASTHSPATTALRPEITGAQHADLAREGFLCVPGNGTFNSQSAFHSAAYLERAWSPLFQLQWFREKGLFSLQDLRVWEKRKPSTSR